jgi:hypothetical protein
MLNFRFLLRCILDFPATGLVPVVQRLLHYCLFRAYFVREPPDPGSCTQDRTLARAG